MEYAEYGDPPHSGGQSVQFYHTIFGFFLLVSSSFFLCGDLLGFNARDIARGLQLSRLGPSAGRVDQSRNKLALGRSLGKAWAFAGIYEELEARQEEVAKAFSWERHGGH